MAPASQPLRPNDTFPLLHLAPPHLPCRTPHETGRGDRDAQRIAGHVSLLVPDPPARPPLSALGTPALNARFT